MKKLVNGVEVELSAEEAAAVQSEWQAAQDAQAAAAPELARIAAIEQEIKDDTVLSNIKGMTKAQYDAWWSANVTNLAQLNGAVKRIVRVVARRNL